MDMNRDQIQLMRSPNYPNHGHCQYFQSLEHKLLAQSDKLTNFIGMSLEHQHTSKTLQSHNSTPKLSITDHINNRPSVKNKIPPTAPHYIQKAKDLVQHLKTSNIHQPNAQKDLFPSAKEKYQRVRNKVYGVSNIKKDEKKSKELDIQKFRHREQKDLKYFKAVIEPQSLKDTVSTSSCKSTPLLSDRTIHFDRVKLDDLDPIKMLGQGKMGQVCLVRHKKTSLLCALKEIPPGQLMSDPKMLIQRIREIKIQSFLDHPNIVQLYSVFVEEGNLYLLMELCSGGNLYEYLRGEGILPQEKIRDVIKQLCNAIEYMHDNDIIHRDIKPQNILFHEDIVKMCDFGWAVHSPLLRDTLCGTPLYSSPQIAQKQQYDNKIDIWNIGVLTYQLAYGKVPFQIRSQDQVVKVVEEDIHFPRTQPASPTIKDFIMRCLCKDPKERFPIGKLIDHQFLSPSDF